MHLLKVLKRIRRDVSAHESKAKEAKAEHEAYLQSAEHKKWLEEWAKKDEDHNELRNDPDPKGWALYLEVIKDPAGHYLKFAEDTCTANPDAGELQAKCLDMFVAGKNTEQALTAAVNIAKLHPRHPKSARAIDKFTTYLKDADTAKLSANAKAQLEDFHKNLLPAFEKGKVTKEEAAVAMEHAHELLKSRPTDKAAQDMVLASLKKDKTAHIKVHLAEKMHRRLVKAGAEATAKTFWTTAE